MATYMHAQGTFVIDSFVNSGNGSSSSSTTGGLVWINSGGLGYQLDTTQDINLGVLWGLTSTTATTALNIDPFGLDTGAAAGSGNWIASQATGMGDITAYGTGALLDSQGISYVVPGAAAGTTIYLVLQGWTGNSPTISEATGMTGQTAPFAITLAMNNSPAQPDVHNMSALVIGDPEPSIPALSALATLAFALFRRRK